MNVQERTGTVGLCVREEAIKKGGSIHTRMDNTHSWQWTEVREAFLSHVCFWSLVSSGGQSNLLNGTLTAYSVKIRNWQTLE